MNEFELEIFEQTSDYSEIRLRRGGDLRTRGLNRAAIDALVEDVDRSYGESSVAHRVFGSVQLRDLGERLFAFLDGEERWFEQVLEDPAGLTVRITAEERLRHLPWELLAKGGVHLTVREPAPLLPVRSVHTQALDGAAGPGNRPLRVLFMATSPESVDPVLNFEAEEAATLRATADTGTELVVEESGSLEGLRFTAQSYGADYFDVLHLSGHATIHEGRPVFLVENELGHLALATAEEIARAMAGRWPRLVFVSGCMTGQAPSDGTLPSMSESLVRAGAPAVLGWALPVGDVSATVFAAQLYGALAAGERLDRSLVNARQQLFTERSANWHLLRFYADKSPLNEFVTSRNTPGRERIRLRHASQEFLDPQTQISRVASRAEFVGRRRVIQRTLRTLKRPLEADGAAQGLVLHGMGGLGKSTLASRLLERMPTHQRVVWFGRIDQSKLRDLVSKVVFESMDQQVEATQILDADSVDLAIRLRYLLDGPLRRIPCLLVFDDFEQGNLDERDGGHVLSIEMATILSAVLRAIEETNSQSRVIITSRYRFAAPTGTRLTIESLETLIGVEQTKKISNLPNLRPGSSVDAAVKARAVEAAAGNPRLLEWLDRIVADTALNVDALIGAIENEADRFRKEDTFAQKLLDAQLDEVRTMLARLNVVELPVPIESVHAIHEHPDAAAHVVRAVQLGLLEEGTDPHTGSHRYFVSNVLRPLLRPLLSDDDHREACAAAARSLYRIWVNPGTDDNRET